MLNVLKESFIVAVRLAALLSLLIINRQDGHHPCLLATESSHFDQKQDSIDGILGVDLSVLERALSDVEESYYSRALLGDARHETFALPWWSYGKKEIADKVLLMRGIPPTYDASDFIKMYDVIVRRHPLTAHLFIVNFFDQIENRGNRSKEGTKYEPLIDGMLEVVNGVILEKSNNENPSAVDKSTHAFYCLMLALNMMMDSGHNPVLYHNNWTLVSETIKKIAIKSPALNAVYQRLNERLRTNER